MNTDFAFLAGHWTSRQRRLLEVLAGCDEWYEFDATLDCEVYLDGNGTFDVLRAPERDLEGITLRLFSPGELVDVVADTKGKGFQGGVKRHGWSGGDATHGSMFHRAPGSIGASSDPSRVWPGHHLPGRMGGERRTVLNLVVVRVIPEQNLLLIRGAVPGATGGLLMVRKSVKQTKAQRQKAKEAR